MRSFILLFASMAAAQNPSLYDYYISGSQLDSKPPTQAGLLLSGGGGDVDEAFEWFLRKAGGGDIVVLRASGADGYHRYLSGIAAVDSVESFVIKSREASYDEFLLTRVKQAEGIFLSGGDQWNYIRMWKGTPLEAALHRHYRSGRPIGGTSAGLAVLGEFSFSAEHDTVTSEEALRNPFNRKVTIEKDFLHFPLLKSTIADSHFSARNRMGRLLVFLARIRQSGRAEARGIGVDEATAILVEARGAGTVVGKASAYFLNVRGISETCTPDTPLSLANIRVQKVKSGERFDFSNGKGGESYVLSVNHGIIQSGRQDDLVY